MNPDSKAALTEKLISEINQSVIPAFKYADLKEFYNQRLSKEMEQVVLSPI